MSDLLINAIQKKLTSTDLTLPVYDPVAAQLRKLLATPGCGMHTIADVIQKDPNLSAQVLKVANSAQFLSMGEVTTITNALIRLGAKQICNIVTMISQHKNFHVKDRHLGDLLRKLWEHSVSTAIGARWLAMRVGKRSDADEAFLGGLMHDFGMLLILRVLDDADVTESDRKDPKLQDILYALHCRLGERLMEEWHLPEVYRNIARHHHEDVIKSPLMNIITLADIMTTYLGIGIEKLNVDNPLQTPQAQLLNMDKSLLKDFEKVVTESMVLAKRIS